MLCPPPRTTPPPWHRTLIFTLLLGLAVPDINNNYPHTATPSPEKPSLQEQEKLPSLFWQFAFVSQLCFAVAHSLISTQLLPLFSNPGNNPPILLVSPINNNDSFRKQAVCTESNDLFHTCNSNSHKYCNKVSFRHISQLHCIRLHLKKVPWSKKREFLHKHINKT